MEALMAAEGGECAKKKGIRNAIIAFIIAMVALTFFSNTLMGISLAEVTVEKASAGTLSHEVTGSGTVESAETADVYVETNWVTSEVAVKVGDKVKAGQELVVFKTRETEDSLKDNQARYAQKQLSLEKLQEIYQETFRSSDEKLMRSTARDIESTQLDMQILERQIANQQRQLKEFSRLTAPVGGIVAAVNAVKGAPVPSGKAAVSIADLSKGHQMKATIDNTKAAYIAVGDKTELIFATLNIARIPAQITDVRDGVSANGQTGDKGKELTFTLKDDRLKGGETGEFDIVKKTASFRSLLPNDAVREDDQGTYVLLLKEKKGPLGTEYVAQRANVQLGDADDTKTSIENGITPLDKVIISSSKSIADGDRVRVNP